MMSVFAGLAVLLATLGLYGVVSYVVHARGREIGIRLAIGATRGRIRQQVLGTGAIHAAAGVAIGIVLMFWGAGWIASRVPGFTAPDAGTLVLAAAAITLTAIAAAWLPAVRATRIDPARTLRAD